MVLEDDGLGALVWRLVLVAPGCCGHRPCRPWPRRGSSAYRSSSGRRHDDGLSIAADAVDLNGGTIRDNAGNDANLDLGYLAFNDNPEYKVDGRLTAVPALPLGGALVLLFALLGGGWRRMARRAERRR